MKRFVIALLAILGIATGVHADDMTATPLTLEAATSGNITFSLTLGYGVDPSVMNAIEYKVNDDAWMTYTWGDAIPVDVGDKVSFRGNNARYYGNGSPNFESHITSTADVYVYGNIMSLINSTDYATTTTLTGKDTFAHLFSTPGASVWEVVPNTTIKSHPTNDLMLPATTLTNMCYYYMFAGCQGITRAPELPATDMTVACYANMFQDCTGLTAAPALPATTFTEYGFNEVTFEEYGSIDCYMSMFEGCTSLATAPALPATKLTHGVYQSMFKGCTSLATAPVLPAKKVADAAYYSMFNGCTSLNYVKCLATDISEDGAVEDWMKDVPAGGTFVKATTLEWPTGASGIPDGWYIENATADDGDMGATQFTMEAIENGTITINNPLQKPIWSSKNGSSWTVNYSTSIAINVVAGDKVRFRADVTSYSDGDKSTNFTSSGDCYIYGNIMSLITRINFPTTTALTQPYAFQYLFCADPSTMASNTTLKNHPDNELVLPATTLTEMCYNGMFHGCQGLTVAPKLPATKLASQCYEDMFAECTGLTEAPKLPATKLAMGCYTMMFYGCNSLTTAPTLPAASVPDNSYDSMFSGCSSLNYVKCLATKIKDYATSNWLDGVAATGTFVKMSQMRDWPAGADGIPDGWTVQAATEADGDNGATPLTLEAVTDGTITIANPKGIMINYEWWHQDTGTRNYASFNTDKDFEVASGDKLVLKGSSSTAYGSPDPSQATHITSTGDVYVYGNVMSLVDSYNFANVTTLPSAEYFACLFGSDDPAAANTTIKNHPTKDIILGATTLTESCYVFMFAGCQGLTRASELPATTLAPICYHRMFGNCTGLTKAPILPAPTLAEECYFAMFDGCSNLSYVKCLATDLGEHNTDEWLNGVAAKGTFIAADGVSWPTGVNGIPEGWRTTELPPLTLEAIEDATTFTFRNPLGLTIEYSTDGGTIWTEANTTTITISDIGAGGTVQLRGNNAAYSSDGTFSNSSSVSCDKEFYAYGNIMSMISSEDYSTTTELIEDYAFARFFYNADKMKNHPTEELILPATTLSAYCYHYMFYGCDILETAPVLPATNLDTRCYNYMFAHCYGLVNAPALPATTLSQGCYFGMFLRCDALTTAPVLPATTLATSCYVGMFYSSGLTATPTLPATNLANNCYNQMFMNCKSLTASPVLPATTLKETCYQNMFKGCTSLETAGNIMATTTASLCCNYMFSGCTALTTAPALPATTLATQCYQRMFEGCTSLVTAPALPATELIDLCYNDMFWECTALKNAPELPATTLADYCYTMMFYGCTSLEKAPLLRAATLTSGCYEHMFMNCSSLSYVKCLATDLGDESSTDGWMTNVAATGVFVQAVGADWTMKGTTEGTWEVSGVDVPTTFIHGIPEGWTVRTDGEYTVTIPASGVSTFSADENVTVPSGLTAYTCTTYDNDASTINATAVSGGVIPAETGVLLRGTAGETYTLTATADEAAAIDDNALVAVTVPTHVAATDGDYTNFMLKSGQFVKIADAPTTSKMPANKAYLQIATASLPTGDGRSITLVWDETTSINDLNIAPQHPSPNTQIYNIQGQRVGKNYKGIVIMNGKRFVKK
jgi:hypothetical protein